MSDARATEATGSIGVYAVRVLAGVVFTAVGIGAVSGIAMLVIGEEIELLQRIVLTAAAAAAYGLASLAAALIIRRGRVKVLMGAAIALCWFTVFVWTGLIWFERSLGGADEENLARIGGTTTVGAIALLYTAVYAMMRTKSTVLSILRWGIVALALLFGSLIVFLFWFAQSLDRYLPPAAMVALATSTMTIGASAGIGSLLVRVLFHVHARRDKVAVESVLARPKLELTCPGCGAEQMLSTGPVRCAECGFTMTIEVEEPRCECGYLLFRLVGDRCPECGRRV